MEQHASMNSEPMDVTPSYDGTIEELIQHDNLLKLMGNPTENDHHLSNEPSSVDSAEEQRRIESGYYIDVEEALNILKMPNDVENNPYLTSHANSTEYIKYLQTQSAGLEQTNVVPVPVAPETGICNNSGDNTDSISGSTLPCVKLDSKKTKEQNDGRSRRYCTSCGEKIGENVSVTLHLLMKSGITMKRQRYRKARRERKAAIKAVGEEIAKITLEQNNIVPETRTSNNSGDNTDSISESALPCVKLDSEKTEERKKLKCIMLCTSCKKRHKRECKTKHCPTELCSWYRDTRNIPQWED